MKYIGWHYSFPCSSKHVSGKLQELAEEMKDDLMMWKEEVTNQRQQFYELNYYTTLQLLQLRQELCNTSTCFDSTVLVQLASISPKVQHCNVTEAVQCVTSRLKSQHSGSPSTSQRFIVNVVSIGAQLCNKLLCVSYLYAVLKNPIMRIILDYLSWDWCLRSLVSSCQVKYGNFSLYSVINTLSIHACSNVILNITR